MAIGAGIAVAVVVAWLALSSQFGGDASNATLAFEAEGSYGDLYIIDGIEEAENPAREDRVLRDVALAGSVQVVDGERVLTYDAFNYEYEGGPLFAYQEEGDDEWVIATLDGREVVEIEEVDSRPSLLVTGSGIYVIEQRAGSCSILRLSGLASERVARSDFCSINGAADSAVLAEQRSSSVEVSTVDLGSGEQTIVADFNDSLGLGVSYSPNNETMMLSSNSFEDVETVVVDLASGEILAEERVAGYQITNDGFFGFEFSSTGDAESTLVYFSNTGEEQEVLRALGLDMSLDPSASMAAVLEFDSLSTILSVAEIDAGGLGPLTEIDDYRDGFDFEFIENGWLLIVDADGVVEVVNGQERLELGELRGGNDSPSPSISQAGPSAWLVSSGESVGLVTGGSNPAFTEIEDLEQYSYGVTSPNGRWLTVVGSEDASASASLVLVDLTTSESDIVDEEDGIGSIQFTDDYVYFEADDNDESEARRVPLRLGERSENLGVDVRLYVPGDPTSSTRRSWDQPFWSFG